MEGLGPAAAWDSLGDAFYHKHEFYTLDWPASLLNGPEIDLRECRCAATSYGGAIAVTLDESKFQRYRGTKSQRGLVQLFSSAGKHLRDIRWENTAIRGVGWTADERLVLISQQGQARHYDLLGNFGQLTILEQQSSSTALDGVAPAAEPAQVVDCRFVGQGFIARLTDNTFIRVDSIDVPRPFIMPCTHITPESQIHCWAVVPATFTQSQSIEVLAAADQTVILLDGIDSQDQKVSQSPFAGIEPSPNGQFLALMTHDGRVLITSSDFSRILSQHSVEAATGNGQICWCGSDAVLLSDGTGIKVLGPGDETIDYFYDGGIAMFAEPDGARIFAPGCLDFVRKVPDTLARVLGPGSTEPATILLEAQEQLEARSMRADENVRAITDSLAEAVDDCIRAAAEALDPALQKQLLRAASLGKGYIDLYNSDEFVDTAETLRVMNALAKPDIGLPLTYEQYYRLTPELLVDRLLQRKQHYLASRICDYLRLPDDRVITHWATLKIQHAAQDDEELLHAIKKKFTTRKNVSYVGIARTAFGEGRVKLAASLLKNDGDPAAQVPLLLDMGEDDTALSRAISAAVPDLVEQVLSELERKHAPAQFFRIVSAHPEAIEAIELATSQGRDPQLIQDLYYQDDRKLDGAMSILREGIERRDDGTGEPVKLSSRVKLAHKMLADGKENAAEVRMLEDHIRLIAVQEQLGKEFDRDFTGWSLLDTLRELHHLGHVSKATKLVSQFKVSDRTWGWIQVRSFVGSRDWPHLESWLFGNKSGQGRKSGVPMDQVAGVVAAAGNRKLALDIADKLLQNADPALKVDLYLKLDEPAKAAEEAAKLKEPSSALERARKLATGADLDQIRNVFSRLMVK
ncbi:Vacuolar protein sorting-associated protein 16 [Savitreella phatthalungensis]